MRSGDNEQLKIPHDIALFLTILIISLLVVASITWIYLNPRPVEQFFALGILGENMMAEHYYPGDNSSIKLGETVKWHITLYNHMGTVQYIAIRAKLLNQTTPPPDDMNNTPSSIPTFREIRRVLVDNETWVFPFYWSVESTSTSNDSQRITMLKLNNMTIIQGLNTTASHGYNFRIVFELWVYGNQSTGFQFGWRSGGEMRSAWIQIWFNLTMPARGQNQTAHAIIGYTESPLVTPFHAKEIPEATDIEIRMRDRAYVETCGKLSEKLTWKLKGIAFNCNF